MLSSFPTSLILSLPARVNVSSWPTAGAFPSHYTSIPTPVSPTRLFLTVSFFLYIIVFWVNLFVFLSTWIFTLYYLIMLEMEIKSTWIEIWVFRLPLLRFFTYFPQYLFLAMTPLFLWLVHAAAMQPQYYDSVHSWLVSTLWLITISINTGR